MIKLNISEQMKYDTIKDLVDNVINIQRASVALNCSIRNIYRLVKKYTKELQNVRCKIYGTTITSKKENL